MSNIDVEQDLDQAELVLAAKDMVDRLQKMAEDLAGMQVEDLMPLVDAMRESSDSRGFSDSHVGDEACRIRPLHLIADPPDLESFVIKSEANDERVTRCIGADICCEQSDIIR